MRPATLAVHPPHVHVPQRPVAPPIHPAASFEGDPEELAGLLRGEGEGFAYARYANPTSAATEQSLARLEEAEAGLWCASGMAAITAVVATACSQGDEVLCAAEIYGVTVALLRRVVTRWGVSVRVEPVDTLVPGPRTRVIIAETISNPTLHTCDLAVLAARKGDAWLVVDNTFATPALCRPLSVGADLVVHSASKYIGGHGDIIAGAVCGDAARIGAIRGVAATMGLTGDPWSAWLAARGIATLPLRMERHSQNARSLATFLRARGLAVHTPAPRTWLSDLGGMLSVALADRTQAFSVMRRLTLFRSATSLGDCHSMVVHPASTSHRDLDDAGLAAVGISQGTVRVSVGIEAIEDLCDDWARALEDVG